MFGILRFLLALLVLYLHAWGAHPWTGSFAVLAFFALSGYLMTLIVHEKYGLTRGGFLKYAINRGLRIFPAYWFTLICTLLVMWTVTGPDFFRDNVYHLMVTPASAAEWLPTVMLFGLWSWVPAQVIPQAWALNVELIFYLAIPLFIGRRREYALACFLTSLVYTVWVCTQHLPLEQRYFLPISGMLPFSLGAVLYFYRDRFQPSAGLTAALMVTAFAHVFVYDGFEPDYVQNVPLYLNVLLFGAAIAALAHFRPPVWLGRLDDFCGRLSYPIYLNHFLVIGLLMWAMPALPRNGPTTFAYALLGTTVLAVVSWLAVERPIERLRARVARAAAATDAATEAATTAATEAADGEDAGQRAALDLSPLRAPTYR